MINFKQISQNKTTLSRNSNNINYIVIHDTGNPNMGANANAHFHYFNSVNRNASADFFVDSTQILQINDYFKYYCWSVGDGNNRYGINNRNSLSIEMCINKNGNYNEMLNKTIWLTKHLMEKLNISITKVVRHWDASRKNCPATMSANNWSRWHKFLNSVNSNNNSNNEWIQSSLNKIGYKLVVDGIIGKLSIAAIKDFQQIANLTVDGVFGASTESKLKTIINDIRLTKTYLSINTLNKTKVGNDVIINDRRGWIRKANQDDGVYWLIYKMYLKVTYK